MRGVLHDAIEPRMREGGDLHDLTGTASKMTGQGVRIAGLLHCAEHGIDAAARTPITAETMQSAADLALYFLEHARIGLGPLGNDPTAAALAWIRSSGAPRFSMRDLQRARGRTADEWAPALGRLARHGFIREAEGARSDSHDYEVNPRLLDGLTT